MNIHPVFVHFPIAFLTIYAIAELFRFKKLKELSWFFPAKFVLLLVGTIGAFFALGTGEFGEAEFSSARAIIHVHEDAATVATTIFCILLASYLIAGIDSKWGTRIATAPYGKVWSAVSGIFRVVFSAPIVVALALAGLVAITVTGALGGAIVYGPDADPVVSFVYSLFF